MATRAERAGQRGGAPAPMPTAAPPARPRPAGQGLNDLYVRFFRWPSARLPSAPGAGWSASWPTIPGSMA
ncbi:MAG: hypothetical protein WKG07_48195 [Hymenobacter sp.]